MEITIKLTKDEVNFIKCFLEEYYNGDFCGDSTEKYDKLADSISRKIRSGGERFWFDTGRED